MRVGQNVTSVWLMLPLPMFRVQRTEKERKPLLQPEKDAKTTVELSPELNCTPTHILRIQICR